MPLHDTPAGTLETREWGDGPELLLLLHAAASSPQALARLAEALQRPGRRIVAPMLNGYGRTAMRQDENPVLSHVAAAEACIDLFPSEQRIVLGHSMGGLVALLLALRGTLPDAMVLYEPIVIAALNPDDPEDAAARDWDRALVNDLGEKLAAGNTEAGVAAFVEGWNETSWNAIPEAARQRLVASGPLLAAETRAVHDCAVEPESFVRVKVPVLLLQGTQSPVLASRIMTGLLRRLPRVRRTILAELGHMGPALKPTPVAGAVEDFLGRTLGRPPG
jgi:pimeloyl-ACP methyl ester carboxylesterase